MKHVPSGKLTVYTTTTNVPTVINTTVNNTTSVNTQSHINNRILPVHPPPHTVNPTNSHLPNVNTILSPSVHYVDNSNTTPFITSTYLYDLLTPHLLHQHSLRTAVHDLLLPLPSTSPIPLHTLTALHRLLSDAHRLQSMLPPLPRTGPLGPPPRTRPMRAPPVSYADPTEPSTFPIPCPISFPFGDLEGVAAAPSTLSTSDSDVYLASVLKSHHMPNSSILALYLPERVTTSAPTTVPSDPLPNVSINHPCTCFQTRWIHNTDISTAGIPPLVLPATEVWSMKVFRTNKSTAPSNGHQATPRQASTPNATSS